MILAGNRQIEDSDGINHDDQCLNCNATATKTLESVCSSAEAAYRD